MSAVSDQPTIPHRVLRLGLLLGAEAVMLMVLFQLSTDLECRETGIKSACRGLRWAGLWMICAASLLGIWLWARPEARAGFLRMAQNRPGRWHWALLHML